jgi:hypothetical protein
MKRSQSTVWYAELPVAFRAKRELTLDPPPLASLARNQKPRSKLDLGFCVGNPYVPAVGPMDYYV